MLPMKKAPLTKKPKCLPKKQEVTVTITKIDLSKPAPESVKIESQKIKQGLLSNKIKKKSKKQLLIKSNC